METRERLVRELAAISAAYRAGSVHLSSLASRVEFLIEQMRVHLSAQDFAHTMNCVYRIEEINAVILDEQRQLTQSENQAIENDISLLENLISR